MAVSAGQTLNDRLLAAKHSIAGQGLAKAICKASTEELIGPKKKHLDCEFFQIFSFFKKDSLQIDFKEFRFRWEFEL